MTAKSTTGISSGAVDLDRKIIQFTLNTDSGPLELTANLGAAHQLLSALAPMAATLREEIIGKGGSFAGAAEAVAEANVAVERFDRLVMLFLVTDKGIPHTFSLSPEAADQISGRLKTESERARAQNPGRA